ncbi:peptidyl-prolyl cis-trans isomerase FKBP5 isoform X2 [Antennarius striatus]|uniref:peptidyl-prolyl cis-trans isomerase FKBP5 isoform X2 n=1 Tax=Antennarius striatus TaxID=241820 RepID=UPI0035AEB6D9
MTTDQDLPIDGQPSTALFAAKGIDVTSNKDKGVIKVVKLQGLDGEQPMIGDKVTIHYTGRLLNGKKFDCSRDRKEPFCFNVGKGQVLKAWDIGVLSMQRGEVCTLLCKPEYAYGTAGNPNKIPPSSSVVFEMELLKFEGETLTDDGGILRRIKVKGDGYTNPNDGASVDVHLEGSCSGRLFDCRDVSFIVGEAEDKGVPLGVDRAMDKMQKGECCFLYLKPKYGFGSEGKPEYRIGPEKDIIYEVTLKDFQRAKESWEMDLNEKLNLATGVKHKGNQYFKVIELDDSNEKALYRRGEARLLRNEFSLAMADFQHVLHVHPSNRAARAQISICQSKIKEHHEQDKKIYANMFQKFAERDAKTGKTKRRRDDGKWSGINGEVVIKRRRRSQDCQL